MSVELPGSVELGSLVIAADRLDLLREDFPEVFHEGKVDFDALKRALGAWVEPGRERFGLSWPGKANAMRAVQQRSHATLVPDRAESVDFDATGNVIIEGENLEVLKLLQRSYYGQIKMIYIDPPYNTGNDFIYPDDYREPLQEYLRYSGQIDGDGARRTTNVESSGRYHSNWLTMMHPRLYLARNLLRDDGVIFVSIDDHEFNNLTTLMNEIFGEENRIGVIVWKKKTNGNNMGLIPPVHDYIVCYGKIVSDDSIPGQLMTQQQITATYSNSDQDPRGPWTTSDLSANHKGPSFPIENVETGEVFLPPLGRYWVFGEEETLRRVADGRIIFGRSNTGRPIQKKFLSDRSSRRSRPESWWDSHGMNSNGSTELTALFGESKLFPHPKPTKTISNLIRSSVLHDQEEIVLDFFAGSGTTGHAVMKLNAEDGGNRKFILVQLPEPADGDYPTISAITRERVRRAGKVIAADNAVKVDVANGGGGVLGTSAFGPTASPPAISSRGTANRRGARSRGSLRPSPTTSSPAAPMRTCLPRFYSPGGCPSPSRLND